MPTLTPKAEAASIEAAPVDKVSPTDRWEKTDISEEAKKSTRLNFILAFDNLPLGERAFVQPMIDRVLSHLSRKEIKAAGEVIRTYPAPTPTLEAAREIAFAIFIKS